MRRLAARDNLDRDSGYLEHAGTSRGLFRDTRSYAHPLYTRLFFGNNFHLEHHLYPAVPCYNLPAVHRRLRDGGELERWRSPVDATLLGPLVHTTSVSQYPCFSEEAAEELRDDPFTGDVFVFFNKGRDRIKLLLWDWNGFWLLYKRLERGTFPFEVRDGGARVEISRAELSMILEGIDARSAKISSHFTTRIGIKSRVAHGDHTGSSL